MKYLIVGLGNIGKEFEETRHNIGFKAVDQLAKNLEGTFESEKLGSISRISIKGHKLILLKPSTYMNLSGKSVRYWMQKEHIKQENVLIISDDLSLPFCTTRLKLKGSEGGHNGLKSITECLGNNEYPRLRVGIGNDYDKGKQYEFVLGKWKDSETVELPGLLNNVEEIIKSFIYKGAEKTMNVFNKKSK